MSTNKALDDFGLSTFNLVFYSCMLFVFAYFLLKGLIEDIFSIGNLTSIIWIILSSMQILKSNKARALKYSRSIHNSQLEQNKTADNNRKDNSLITLSIIGIILCLISLVAWLNIEPLFASYNSKAGLEVFNVYLYILSGLFLITMELENLINSEKRILKRGLLFITIILGLANLILLCVYGSYLPEVGY